jgi:hypothetical protein
MADQGDTGGPTDREIDDKYSEVDPDVVAENAIDYFADKPETESEKADEEPS